MPRQQAINFKYARPEVDVWAAAAALYFLLTGHYPRDFTPGKDVWQVVLQTDAVPIRKRNAAIPRRLAEVIDAALVDNPEIQVKTATELRRPWRTPSTKRQEGHETSGMARDTSPERKRRDPVDPVACAPGLCLGPFLTPFALPTVWCE